MSEPTLKPGTRCACSGYCEACERRPSAVACQRDAVRMVTVPWPYEGTEENRYVERPRQSKVADLFGSVAVPPPPPLSIPMCAPCAEYHEAKAVAK